MELLRQLIAAESHTGNYEAMIACITTYLAAHTSAKIIRQDVAPRRANIIAVFGKPKLVINAHMDTVPPVGAWQTNPLQLSSKKDKWYGLGTTDTKGSLYAVLTAASQAKPKDLMLLFSVDEEQADTLTGVGHFLASTYKKGLTYALVCEPTELAFVNRHQGYCSFKISTKAKPAHSSEKNKENAITKAAAIVLALQYASFNIGMIKGGKRVNIVADNCEVQVSFRSYDLPQSVKKKIEGIVHGIDNSAEVAPLFLASPLLGKEAFPFLKENMHKVSFWTEAALFAEAGIPAIVFGAGSIKQAHTQDEFVEKKQLKGAVKKFTEIMRRWP